MICSYNHLLLISNMARRYLFYLNYWRNALGWKLYSFCQNTSVRINYFNINTESYRICMTVSPITFYTTLKEYSSISLNFHYPVRLHSLAAHRLHTHRLSIQPTIHSAVCVCVCDEGSSLNSPQFILLFPHLEAVIDRKPDWQSKLLPRGRWPTS